MKNGDYIRSLDDDRLARLLFIWGINTLSLFLEYGGMRIMDARQLREWLDKLDFMCDQTLVPKDFIFGQDFFLKEGGEYEER